MPIDEHDLARLLSGRDRPSVLEKEAVFDAVMREVAPPARPARLRLLLGLGTACGAAALAALLWMPAPRSSEDAFTARGASAAGVLVAHCGEDAAPRVCVAGQTLGLELEPPAGRPYFALFARRPDGAVVWYFPAPGGVSASVAGQRAGALWSEAAVLAADAPHGEYTLVGVFSARPLSRAQIKALFDAEPSPSAEVTVIERALSVEGGP
jgi:hypothetical protein